MHIFSQGRSNYWPLGYASYSVDTNLGGMTVEYPNNSFYLYKHPRWLYASRANAAISNDTGAILFYTNGVYVANAKDDTMKNGSGLNPSAYTNTYYIGGLFIPQGNIIIPKPNSDSLYFLFHETIDFPLPLNRPRYLYCSTIDMSLDANRGEVIIKNEILIDDTLFVGGITACKHANGRDWWVLVPESRNQLQLGYYVLNIQPDTIIIASHLNFPVDSAQIGQACFSPDGSKLILSYIQGCAFFDFDRCSGTLTLIDTIVYPTNSFSIGASVSPNSRYAYVNLDAINILQYDLQAANIPASEVTVAVYDGFQAPLGINTVFVLHQIGVDGKIYITTSTGTFAMHAIENPDSGGLACNVNQHAIILPRYNFSIPNFPNYDLGVLPGSPCDTLGLSLLSPTVERLGVRLFPNPANNSFYIKYNIPTNENLLFVLYDSYGNEVLRKNLYGTFKNLLVHTEQLNNGIYFWRVTSNKNERRESGKVVILR
ncbi:MAG: T9SS type A sorting domain-containing protein [Bacteroidetes bacterium]|nr:T9SS type A sorting domain-containing protein [Bacteroidota bacterium]